jgi:hypothetical protein
VNGFNQESTISAINGIDAVIKDISEEISLLHQLSNTIRKASSERHNLKAATSFEIKDEQGNDIGPLFMNLFSMEIIRRKFPDCDEVIQKKLAVAMLLRRKRILYRRSRYGKFPARNAPSAPQNVVSDSGKAQNDFQSVLQLQSVSGPFEPKMSDVKCTQSAAGSRAFTATTLNMEQWRKASTPSVYSKSKTIHLSCHEELNFPPAPTRPVLQKLKALKEQRLVRHEERLNLLPNYSLYLQHNGHPPLEPDVLDQLRNDISNLEGHLQQEIESDRRGCYDGNMEVICPYCCCALSSGIVMNSRQWM